MMGRLILGYDGSCAMCTRTARRFEKITSGTIDVVALQSATMARARMDLLGPDAPWAPTLIEVRNGQPVRAWVGRALAVRLAREVGPVTGLRLAAALGEEQRNGLTATTRAETVGADQTVGPTRRTVFQVAAGVATGMIALVGMNPRTAMAASGAVGSRVPGTTYGPDQLGDLLDLLHTPDARAVLSPWYPDHPALTAAARIPQAGIAAEDPARRVTLARDLTRHGFQLMGHERPGDDGAVHKTLGLLDEANARIIRCTRTERAGATLETTAEAYTYQLPTTAAATTSHLEAEERGFLRVLARSVNGAGPSLPSHTGTNAETTAAAASDPCGGCTNPGPGSRDKKTAIVCDTNMDLACALGLAGCAGCVAGCTTATAGCVFCIVTSCGGLLASGGCCQDGKTHSECRNCAVPL